MITRESILAYLEFEGDIDLWSRCRSRETGPETINDQWRLIDWVVQGLFLVEQGLASEAFAASAEADLLSHTTDPETRALIHQAVERLNAKARKLCEKENDG
jgi:hypothetical protein